MYNSRDYLLFGKRLMRSFTHTRQELPLHGERIAMSE
jgi:hypothetical protein